MERSLKIKVKSNEGLPDFSGYTFLLPSVSVGNVGQLSVDVIITSLNTTKVAILHHPALLPIVGHDPYNINSSEVATAADLHLCNSKKLLILQIRSPLILEEKKAFLDDLVSWIKESSFRDVLIVSSCYAHLRRDSQLVGPQVRYLANAVPHPDIGRLKEIGAMELEEREDDSGAKARYIPGAGFMYEFLDLCSGVPAVALIRFADDGDNTGDAFSLVSFLNSWTKYQETERWKSPFSWKNLFGSAPPPLLY